MNPIEITRAKAEIALREFFEMMQQDLGYWNLPDLGEMVGPEESPETESDTPGESWCGLSIKMVNPFHLVMPFWFSAARAYLAVMTEALADTHLKPDVESALDAVTAFEQGRQATIRDLWNRHFQWPAMAWNQMFREQWQAHFTSENIEEITFERFDNCLGVLGDEESRPGEQPDVLVNDFWKQRASLAESLTGEAQHISDDLSTGADHEKEIARRGQLLAEYKSAAGDPSNRRIYESRNSGIHKPEFYSWRNGELSV